MKRTPSIKALIVSVSVAGCGGTATEQTADLPQDAGHEASAEASVDAKPDVPPGTWVDFDAQGLFTFRAPVELEGVPVSGIDSYVGKYETEDLILHYDYGGYSDPLESYDDNPEYVESSVQVDGKAAKLITLRRMNTQSGFTYVAAIHFPLVTDDGAKLTMWGEGRTAEHQQVAVKIFETIDFP